MSASSPLSIVWFRQDLRLDDHPALRAALREGSVLPVYIWDPEAEGDWAPGGASRWWIHHALADLDQLLRKNNSQLILRSGNRLHVLRELIQQTGAQAIYWNRRYEPAAIEGDRIIETTLRKEGFTVKSFNGSLLREPHELQTQSGGPYKVFTPFWRKGLSLEEPEEPLPAPRDLRPPPSWPTSIALEALHLLPTIPWAGGLAHAWNPTTHGAQQELNRFLERPVRTYAEGRDIPADNGTSRLSPYLHFGQINSRMIWHAIRSHELEQSGAGGFKHAEAYLRQLGWRDFAHHLLVHFPHTPTVPLHEAFKKFPWDNDPESLRAWQKGQTGYPIVDAGMRQLWITGWMHNRVRMVVASFLVKHLLLPWQAGAAWFWDTLVDADLANNTLGWQWAAGCGADAAPYFRIFNPMRQGERFDPGGDYVRRWIPELKSLPSTYIHTPWTAPLSILDQADIKLGVTYPHPIIDHNDARERALDAYARTKT